MWRFRLLVMTVVVLGVLLFGAVVAHAGWSWNSQINVEGVEVRTEWTVVDDQTGQSYDSESASFHTTITATFPTNAVVEVLATADTESVEVQRDGNLQCKADGVEAEFVYNVSSGVGVNTNKMVATIYAGGQYLDEVTGHLDENLKFQVMIPMNDPDCS